MYFQLRASYVDVETGGMIDQKVQKNGVKHSDNVCVALKNDDDDYDMRREQNFFLKAKRQS